MEETKNSVDLGDKKSYAGIPEAEFVVSNRFELIKHGYIINNLNSIYILIARMMLMHIWQS